MEKKKEFSKFFIASLKRTAQNVNPLVRRKDKILSTIYKLKDELISIQAQIDGYQTPIKVATGGWTTEDLVERVVTETTKLDKDGKPIKMTQYILKYPETIIPPTEIHGESGNIVVDDNDNVIEDEGPEFDGAGFTEEDRYTMERVRKVAETQFPRSERPFNNALRNMTQSAEENKESTLKEIMEDPKPTGEILID